MTTTAFEWFIEFVKSLSRLWEFLSTPVIANQPLTTPISLLGFSGLALVIGYKIVRIFI